MSKDVFSCETCGCHECYKRSGAAPFPAFCPTAAAEQEKVDAIVQKMKNSWGIAKIALVSAEIEGQFYGKYTRVEETIAFLQRIGSKKVGIASCLGLLAETRMLTDIFDKKGIPYYTVCCKIGGVDKSEIGIPDENKLNRGCGHESMCNPLLQAEALNEQKTDFNIIMGLCVGHDMLFTMHSKAPVTTLVVKDRVLAHNTVGALYTSRGMYSRFK